MELRPNPPSFLEIARGNVPGHSTEHKFGRSTDVDSGGPSDIWDLSSQPLWLPPTTARTHDIVSSSASDDGAPAGAGARTLRVFGLTAWDADEATEDITLNGVGAVPTASAYVIIHRMEILTKGASGPNVGTITATAQVDGTITAQINPGEGQTQMAIYGVPSTKTAFMTSYYSSFNKSGGQTGAVDVSLCVNPEPDVERVTCVIKHTQGMFSNGTSLFEHSFPPYFRIPGPALIKIRGIASVNNLDISAGFHLILVDV